MFLALGERASGQHSVACRSAGPFPSPTKNRWRQGAPIRRVPSDENVTTERNVDNKPKCRRIAQPPHHSPEESGTQELRSFDDIAVADRQGRSDFAYTASDTPEFPTRLAKSEKRRLFRIPVKVDWLGPQESRTQISVTCSPSPEPPPAFPLRRPLCTCPPRWRSHRGRAHRCHLTGLTWSDRTQNTLRRGASIGFWSAWLTLKSLVNKENSALTDRP